MSQIVNYKYEPVFFTDSRYIILMGGRSAGRSFVASQLAIAKLRAPEYFRCAIMRFILSDVKKSIYQEIVDRIEENEYKNVRQTNLGFECGGNLIHGMGFRKSQSDQKSKLKSLASYNYVIIEEADEVSEEDFQQLDDSIRTMKSDIKIILLLNPPNKDHWIVKRWFNLVESKDRPGFYKPELKKGIDDTLYIHTTYRDNIANINASTLKNFERYKETKPDHHASMIDGLVTEGKRGRIFKNWKPISKEEYDKLEYDPFYGLDFGFTNDPTALNELKQHNNKLYIFELIYETGLTNSDIAKRLETLGVKKTSKIWGDSSEPKSVVEIRREGWNIEGAVKGPGSVSAGLDLLADYDVYYVETSTNTITEMENYSWKLDRNKEPTNDPIDDFNHSMDATRYGAFSEKHNKKSFGFV